ncbi:phage tail tape measure protein [Rikenella microfusus]|uniref:phage tail tape measure protein n=1 Tax=Rikenella microfusus TaxID=28139 RepID=UPI00248DE156|nr:phage tail tape measure protein [Rikenella microfusus]
MKSANKEGTTAYRKTTAEITKVKREIKSLTDTLKEQEDRLGLTGMSYNQLKKKAGELTKELYNMSRAANPEDWKKKTEKLKQYQNQMAKMQQGIKMVNASFKTPKSSTWSNLKQLIPIASIVGIGNQLKSTAERAIETYTRLDDKMADVQKTTGMSKEEVKALDAELMKIDTRTSREDLLDLARVAGKLGVAKEEVAGFVRATDQIRVALSEDLGNNVEESIQMVGKLTSIFHLREEMGLERSLLAVGSAINSLGAASEANESYLVDFTNRTAGVAPQAKVSIQNVLGLGATLDQLGQTAEVAGTTYTQVITGMFKRTEAYAKVAGMSVSEFSKLLKEDANEAFIRFLEGANNGGDMEAMTKSLALLKLEGTRSTQVIGALAGNVDMLRQQQALANAEFAKATSLTEEYNTKNDSAQAEIEKRRKAIDQIIAALGEKLMPLWSNILGLTASGLDILKALVGTLIEYRGVILSAVAAGTAYIGIQKLRNFYSKANRLAILEEVVAIKTGTLAAAKATTGAYALAAAKALVTLQFRAAATAAKAFFVSLGPIGWAITAISVLIPLISGAKRAIDAASESSERLSREQAKLNSELSVETSKINILFNRLRNAKKGTDEYAKAKQAILSQYGSYLEGMDKEIKSLEDVQGAYEAITRAVRESVIERLRANQIEDAAQEAGKSWEEALTSMDQNLQKAFKKGKEGLAKTLFPIIREALDAENTTVLSDIEAARYRVLQTLQNTYGKKGAATIYNRISGDIEDYLKATDKFKARQEEINRIYGEGILPASSGRDSVIEEEDNETKPDTNKWSLDSDEAFMGKKIALKRKLWQGEIATEAEYNRQLLALEIEALQARLDANIESGEERQKLQMELLDRQYQQAKAGQSRLQKLLDVAGEGNNAADKENAAYEKRLRDLELFGKQREDLTKEELAALVVLERQHMEKLSAIYVDELSKEISGQQKAIQRKATALKQSHNDELAAATTFEQKKALLAQWFSAEELRRVKTDKEADRLLKAQYAAEEQAAMREDLEQMLTIYQSVVKEVGETGFISEGVKATEEDKAKLLAIIDELKKELAELGATPAPSLGGADKESEFDLLGMSSKKWEELFDNIQAGNFGLNETLQIVRALGNAFGEVSKLMAAMEQRDLKAFTRSQEKRKKAIENRVKAGQLSEEQAASATQKIDEETEARTEELQNKQAKREKALGAFNITISTAVAVAKALEAGAIIGPILAGVIAAMGAVQLATLLATPLPGAEKGGLIGVEREQDGKHFNAEFSPRRRGYVHRPTVIQTSGGQSVLTGEAGTEYVVPNDLLRVPEVAGMVNLIEAARLHGSFRPVNLSAAMAAGAIPGRAAGGYTGDNPLGAAMIAGGQVPTSSAAYDAGLLRELCDTVGKLSRQLDKPILAQVAMAGDKGLARQLERYNKTVNASRL